MTTTIKLPIPTKTGGMPLMDAITKRVSTRVYASQEISLQVLSNIFYAAWGVSRDDGRLTIPTANNSMNMVLYAVTQNGVYRYNNVEHALNLVVAGDFRKDTGRQDFVETAPLQIAILMDEKAGNERFLASNIDRRVAHSYTHAGYISQNIYLVCAANGLATVARAFIDHAVMRQALKLDDTMRIMLVQSIGYPA